MEKYDITIIVPVHNRENIIKPCIESINAQTYNKSKWEVLFVDDASTDRTLETIESMIDNSINYKILKRPIGSGNASAPRNDGIKTSLGKYIFFLDSDDYIDSQLLKNGMKIASKNNSDMVYFKLAKTVRVNTVRPFRNKFVDSADILENHLMRSLKIFKMYKTKMIKDNNILCDVTVDVFEDMLFSCMAIIYSKKISILADRDYYYAIQHDGEHLSKKKITIERRFSIYFDVLTAIYKSKRDFDYKSKIYNAWAIRATEYLRDYYKKNNKENDEFKNIFLLMSDYFKIHKEFFDLSQIYDNEKPLVICLLNGDFVEFCKIVNVSKFLVPLQKEIQQEFKNITELNKVWIHKNRIVVADFSIRGNRIAFDIQFDKNNKFQRVWMFSRNKPQSLKYCENNVISVSNDKYLIYESDYKVENLKEIKEVINKYLEERKSKWF